MEKKKLGESIIWEFDIGGLWPFLEFELQTNKYLTKEIQPDDDLDCIWCSHAKEKEVNGNKASALFDRVLVIFHKEGSVGVCADCVDRAIKLVKTKEEKNDAKRNDTPTSV